MSLAGFFLRRRLKLSKLKIIIYYSMFDLSKAINQSINAAIAVQLNSSHKACPYIIQLIDVGGVYEEEINSYIFNHCFSGDGRICAGRV